MFKRLIVSAVLSLPVMLLSMVGALQFPGWQWVVALLALPVVTWCAWPFHRPAFKNLRHGAFTMDTLVSLGVIAATGWSLWALLAGSGLFGFSSAGLHMYFEGATMVVTFLLTGRVAESRAKSSAASALEKLLDLGAKTTTLVVSTPEGVLEREVEVSALRVGDVFRVRPGQKVATDGVVLQGVSTIDKSLLTGESLPVEVGPGDEVVGATMNTSGSLLVRASRVGAETTLAQIGRLVESAQSGKAPIQRLADAVAGWFVPAVLCLSAFTLVGWLLWGGGLQAALTAAVSVLVVACPCALGLATPMALLVGSGRASQNGILLKGPQVLEAAKDLDTVVLDKTGTVTAGRMSVSVLRPAAGFVSEDLLSLAAAVESGSEHPIARAIVSHADGVFDSSVLGFWNVPGSGALALLPDGESVVLAGRPSWVNGFLPSEVNQGSSDLTVVAVARGRLDSASFVSRLAGVSDSQPEGTNVSDLFNEDAVSGSLVRLSVEGMTCASCVRRVEKKLEKVPGVRARVNLATNSASVEVPAGVSAQDLVSVVEKAGYGARVQEVSSAIETPNGGVVESLANGDVAGSQSPNSEFSQLSATDLLACVEELTFVGLIEVSDTVKPTSREAISQLKELGLEPILLTGDAPGPARAIADEVGISQVFAGVLPDQKQQVVRDLQERGHRVAMVGDGVNDAAALAQAGTSGLGMAMGSGSDVAIEAADVTLVNPDLRTVAMAVRISRATLRNIKENLAWAFGYNLVALPLAVLGLINPMIASAFMAFSSVAVVLNSLRLRRLPITSF
ncbi:HAD-IC family P-type ATPase [Actinomycetaceae bacterium TAE3-ERU4]|nr:HAD-IC family P-type ATPase [Actinomycetaceae bacterium TAE3-ERU4]